MGMDKKKLIALIAAVAVAIATAVFGVDIKGAVCEAPAVVSQ